MLFSLSSMATNIFLNLISVLQQTGFDLTSFDVLFFKVYFGDHIPASETVKIHFDTKLTDCSDNIVLVIKTSVGKLKLSSRNCS
jgi:hypothetical protein